MLGVLIRRALRQVLPLAERLDAATGDLVRTARFVVGRVEFAARDDDIYIASYPRSGTTWVQFLVHLMRGGSIDFDHIAQVTPWFERSLALGQYQASDLIAFSSPRIFKTHLPYRWLPPRGRCIYIARDGRDVALSYYHLYRTHLGYRGDFDQFFERFIRGQLQYRCWFRHVAGWRALHANPRVLHLDYEALQSDLPAAVQEIAAFCGFSLDAARRKRVLEMGQFDFMKDHEHKFDHATAEAARLGLFEHGFLRRGEVGEGRRRLTAEQERRFTRLLARGVHYAGIEPRIADFLH